MEDNDVAEAAGGGCGGSICRSPVPALREVALRLSEDLALQVLDLVRFSYQVASCSDWHGDPANTIWGRGRPRRLRCQRGGCGGVRFFPLGDRALTWSRGGSVVIWDTESGRALHELRHDGPVECARVFPKGDRVVTCNQDGTSVVWDAGSGEALSFLAAHRYIGGRGLVQNFVVRDVEVFPSGDRVLTWGHRTWGTVWDASAGEVVCLMHRHASAVIVAGVSPRGDRMVTGSLDHTAVIWDASTCEALHVLDQSYWVTGVAFLMGGSKVATLTASGGTTIWNAVTGERLRALVSPDIRHMNVAGVFVSFPRDDRLAIFDLGAVVVWNASSGDALYRLASDSPVGSIAVSPQGDVVATCDGIHIVLWDAGTGARLQTLPDVHPVSTVAPAVDPSGAVDVERWPPTSCAVAIGFGGVLEPLGFGHGLSWEQVAP